MKSSGCGAQPSVLYPALRVILRYPEIWEPLLASALEGSNDRFCTGQSLRGFLVITSLINYLNPKSCVVSVLGSTQIKFSRFFALNYNVILWFWDVGFSHLKVSPLRAEDNRFNLSLYLLGLGKCLANNNCGTKVCEMNV